MAPSVAIIGTRGYPSYYGGFETLVRELAPALCANGWNVTVYGREKSTRNSDPNRDPRVQNVVTRGIETKSLSTLTYGLSSTVSAATSKPDVALVMNVANGFWLPILKSRRVPTVVNVDGIEWERAKWGRGAKAAFRSGARMTARYADRLIVDARAIGHRWASEFGRRGDYIPYGGTIPPEVHANPNMSEKPYILMVARFVPENSIVEFFAAAEFLARKWQIIIVGSSGYGGRYDQMAENLQERHENVKWLGHVSNDDLLFALWQNAGAYFHGHSVGGTNPALVQAMACGAPIVARDTVFNREVLGDAGHFVRPDPLEIVRALDKVMENPSVSARLRKSAQARQLEYFTWELVCKNYESALAETAGLKT
ncbi:glycosyltransferase [Rhodococcus ruber]|uniref:glycosyltransferase n=1 Tax=Rhodococcus ruber TaxID=1830 RepID=UPI003D818269